jgi:hypothetical protein
MNKILQSAVESDAGTAQNGVHGRLAIASIGPHEARFASTAPAPAAPSPTLVQLARLLGRQAARKHVRNRSRGWARIEVPLLVAVIVGLMMMAIILFH